MLVFNTAIARSSEPSQLKSNISHLFIYLLDKYPCNMQDHVLSAALCLGLLSLTEFIQQL